MRPFSLPGRWLPALLPHVAVLAACSAAPAPVPPPASPPCPSAPVPAVAPPPATVSAAAPAASTVAMQPKRDAAAAGLCTAAERSAADDEIDAIAKLVRALPDDASPADPVTERIEKLFASKCYSDELAQDLDVKELRAARARAVVAWWNTGGGSFLQGALDQANGIHFAPTVPALLAAEVLPASDPMRAVVCTSSAAACDPPADAAILDLGREIERVKLLRDHQPRFPPRDTGEPATPEACAASLRTHPPAERLFHYSTCLEPLVPRRAALPLARYRSPKGWLVLRGRRGHYGFCDEVRAYHLETGSAYIASRCAGLVLRHGGAVDQAATRAGGAVTTRVGTLSTDALRRLVLLLYLKDRVDSDFRPYAEFGLPAGVPMPDPAAGHRFKGTGGGSGWGHSGQTTLHFEVTDGATTLYTSTFTWPDAHGIGDQVADDLVVSAEASFQEGCPRAALPNGLAAPRATGGVSAIDASPDALRKNAEDLATALAGLRKVKLCKK